MMVKSKKSTRRGWTLKYAREHEHEHPGGFSESTLSEKGMLSVCDLSRGPCDAGVELQQYPGRHPRRGQPQDERMRTAYIVWVAAPALVGGLNPFKTCIACRDGPCSTLRGCAGGHDEEHCAAGTTRPIRNTRSSDRRRARIDGSTVCEHALGKAGLIC